MSTELTREVGGKPTRLMRFEALEDVAQYDGIWACASLLHVQEMMMKDVMRRMVRALKPGGVLFASFKHGDGEMERKGRTFTMVSEETLRGYMAGLPVEEVKVWMTQDVRDGREREKWVSGIFTEQSI
jgi:SAM-dependent methyltransferase